MPKSQVVSIDACIDGWDAYNSYDNMPPTAAVLLDNLIPNAGTVDTRKGSTLYADTNINPFDPPSPIETLVAVIGQEKNRLLAARSGGFYDITDPDFIIQPVPEGTFQNDRWQYTNFRKADEDNIVILCNGVDPAYSTTADIGAVWTQLIFNDGAEPPQPVVGDFIGVLVFKGRTYYWKDDSDSFWYTQAGSYQGEIQEYPLGAFVKKGGKIVDIVSWTQQDSGDGKDDFLVFIFSTGEILVYQGDDPETIGFFEMVGRYVTAPPLSIRGSEQYGADTVIMTKDGYITLSTIIQKGRVSDVPAFSRMIHNAITQRTETRADKFGWQATLHSDDGLFIFNVPLSDTSFEQHVLNTVTMKWCRFNSLNTPCHEIFDGKLYGGTLDGKVLHLLDGTSDQGNPILFEAIPAFNFLGDAGNHKVVSAAQVITTHSKPVAIQLTGIGDFNIPTFQPVMTPSGGVPATWSINPPTPPVGLGSFWDEDYWARGDQPFTTAGWQNVSAFGYAVTVAVRFSKVNESVRWRSSGLRFHIVGAQ